MKSGKDCEGGFTLIELLVVVLIIGILAASALPQYQVAVMKSRILPLLSTVRSIAEAERRYKMANGGMVTYDVDDLDVSLPTGFVKTTDTDGEGYTNAIYTKDKTSITISQKSSMVYAALLDKDGKEVVTVDYILKDNNNQRDAIRCEADVNNSKALSVCKSICGTSTLNERGSFRNCYLQGEYSD